MIAPASEPPSAPPLAIDALLDALPRCTLVVGKGGVGKTTCSASLAIRAAERGRRTLLLSTDPANTLGAALGLGALPSSPAPVPGVIGFDAQQLDASVLREAFLARWRDTLVTIVDRGTYLDTDDITGLIDATLPGGDEIFALLRLAELERAGEYDRIIVDTAPTGHTLRLLALPQTFHALVSLLDAMQNKHRFVVRALMHRYRADAADAFLGEMRSQADGIRAALADARRIAAVLVTRDEEVVVAESARLRQSLAELGVAVDAIVVNSSDADHATDAAAATDVPVEGAAPAPRFVVPRLARTTVGVDGLREWGASMETLETVTRSRPIASQPRAASSIRASDAPGSGAARADIPRLLVRPLTIVGGKGGVGKTSVACALALAVASEQSPTLLVSTDPAPSIADALAMIVTDEERSIENAPGLTARQMDAAAAFDRLRTTYRERIDALFDSFVAHGLDAAHDRAILRELLSLAPPGIDELYALASLGETLSEGAYAQVIVDPAPTGHLLRLLEMPAMALDWSHRLMRLMLKYRDVGMRGETAEEVLAFSRRTRALQALLHDASRAAVVVVSLDEPLVRGETSRLVQAVRSRGLAITGLLWNRLDEADPATPLVTDATAQYRAPAAVPPPVGLDALRAWTARWCALDPAPDSHSDTPLASHA